MKKKATSRQGLIEDMYNYITKCHKNQSGIIYCLSRADCEFVAQELQNKKLSILYYHAQLDPGMFIIIIYILIITYDLHILLYYIIMIMIN